MRKIAFIFLFSYSLFAQNIDQARQAVFADNQPLWRALFSKVGQRQSKLPHRNIKIALIGEGFQLQDFPEYINSGFVGYNFESKSSDLSQMNKSILTAHEQNIFGLWDGLARKLNINQDLRILPMVVTKPYITFDPTLNKKIADAIRLSADQGVDVISVSYTSSLSSDHFLFIDGDRKKSIQYVQDAINYATQKGSIVFAAASNNKQRDHSKDPAGPCDLQGVFCVSNSNFDYQVVSASGAQVDGVFFGTGLTTFNHNYKKNVVTGTSFATPLLALLFAYTKVVHEEEPSKTLERFQNANGAKVKSLYGLKQPHLVSLPYLDLID